MIAMRTKPAPSWWQTIMRDQITLWYRQSGQTRHNMILDKNDVSK